MSTNDAASAVPPNRVVHTDIVSPFCTGACDDIRIVVEDGAHVLAVEGGCTAARNGFKSAAVESTAAVNKKPVALVEQRAATLDEAIDRAVGILIDSHAPLVFALEHLTCEAQSLAVSLADRLGATIDTTASERATSRGTALTQAGESTCSWGDIRDRADFVLLWAPFTCHLPCQLYGRLLDAKAGGFFGRGRSDQTVVILEERRRRSASESLTDEAKIKERSSALLAIREQSGFEAVCVLRALVKSLPLDPEAVQQQTGLPLEQWKNLADQMRHCRYGAILWSAHDPQVEVGLSHLAAELNDAGRFAGLSINKAGMNAVGAEQVLAWRTGYSSAVNFAAGFPLYNPTEFAASAVLGRGEADAAVLFGSPNGVVHDDLSITLPTIVIAPEPVDVFSPTVFIRTARPGVQSAGTIFRFDGVPLPLRKIIATSLPPAENVLKTLLTKLGVSQQMTHAKTQRRQGKNDRSS